MIPQWHIMKSVLITCQSDRVNTTSVLCVWKETDWWRSRSSCDSEWTRCWNRWPERGCSRSSSPAGRTVRWRSDPLPSLCRCPPPKQKHQRNHIRPNMFNFRKQSQHFCSKGQTPRSQYHPRSIISNQLFIHPPWWDRHCWPAAWGPPHQPGAP